MSNEERIEPRVEIDLLGGPKYLCFTLKSDIRLKKLLDGQSIMKGCRMDDPEVLVKVLWAGMIKHQPEFDLPVNHKGEPSKELQKVFDDIAEELTLSRCTELFRAVNTAVGLSLGDDNAKAERVSGEKKS